MNKPSSVHPVLKTALQNLELELEAEIARYQQPKAIIPSSPSDLDIPASPISCPPSIIEVDNLVDNFAPSPKSEQMTNIFTTPFGLTSLILTILGSSLLGFHYTQTETPVAPPSPSPLSSITEGLNLATEAEPLNLKSLSKIKLTPEKINSQP